MARLLQLLFLLAWLVGGLAAGPGAHGPDAPPSGAPHADDPRMEISVEENRIRLVVRTPWDTTWRTEAPLPSFVAPRRPTAVTPSRCVPTDRHGAPPSSLPHPHPSES